jgi:hypothetical protein
MKNPAHTLDPIDVDILHLVADQRWRGLATCRPCDSEIATMREPWAGSIVADMLVKDTRRRLERLAAMGLVSGAVNYGMRWSPTQDGRRISLRFAWRRDPGTPPTRNMFDTGIILALGYVVGAVSGAVLAVIL